jgi:signal transduction histidine kinase
MILKLDRVASRGKMARDIAHEINNYLAVLQGNLELMPMLLAKNDMPKVDEKLGLMKKTVANISTFTEGLSRFSDENSEFAKEDLNQLIENLLAFVKPQNKFDNIYIGTNLADDLPMVTIDASQIQLLIVSLLSNSAEALAETDDRKWIVVSTSVSDNGREFYIKFADGGPGIPEEYHERLFISRFSTRRDGNGLGLITCKNIVDNHRGEISYHKSEESKAIFIVRLPIEHPREDETTEINYAEDRSVPSAN